MKKTILKLITLISLCGAFMLPTDFPSIKITNGLITAELHLPDANKGYYRGTRFDWSGVIPSLTYKGHSYFGVWNPAKYDPKLHDAITGPVEEFTVLGYNEASVGGEFLMIGIGSLIKPDSKAHNRFKTYDIKNTGKWRVKKKSNQVNFTHKISNVAGYGYVYKKTVKLTMGKPELVLEHYLKNTGSKTIETSVYNHNFFMIDNELTSPNVKTSFPFDVKAQGKGFDTVAIAQNKAITYTRVFEKGESIFSSGLQGFGQSPDDYNILIENLKTGASVRITADKPLEKFVFWACTTTSCPEPYIKLSIKPQEEVRWTIKYEFSVETVK